MGRVRHHIGEVKDQPFVRQGFGLCRVNGLGRVVIACGEAVYLLQLAPSTLTSMAEASHSHLIEGVYHPGQEVNRLTDENQIAGKGIARRVVASPGAGRFKDEGMRGKRLPSEDGTVFGDGGFKALGIHALPGKLTLIAASPSIADAGDFAQEVSQLAAEDVAFVLWHRQRFLDDVGEAVAGEAEVWEHDYERTDKSVGGNNSLQDLRTSPTRAASMIPAKWLLSSLLSS